MALILFKWLFVALMSSPAHPVYVSVTEIEHNNSAKTLEVSCKIFTDDFEKTLRFTNTGKIDLLDKTNHVHMEKVVSRYITDHLKISVNGKKISLKFLGFEQQEEGIISYLQADNITEVKEVSIFNDILYEYKPEQMGIMHVVVNGERKSTKLLNPSATAVLQF